MRKAYKVEVLSDTEMMYVHREDGSNIVFRLGSDGYYHTKLACPDGYAVSSVDFYNPAPLVPVPPIIQSSFGLRYDQLSGCIGQATMPAPPE
jgi:hypothetical protein